MIGVQLETSIHCLCVCSNVVIQEEVVQHHLPAPQYQNLIIQHMDIAEPLNTLKQLLELRLQCSLADHQFYLQDSIPVSHGLVKKCDQLKVYLFYNDYKTSYTTYNNHALWH